MTVKELFLSIGFDNVFKALQNTHRNNRSIQNVAGYKEAFDIICLTEFKGEGGEVTFDVSPRDKWYEDHSLPLVADNVEGDHWNNTVGKTVVRPDNNPFTDAELAGAILWGMTFYGFTRHTKWSPLEERFTSYGKKAEALERRLYLPYIRDKEEKRKLKSNDNMPFGIAFTLEVWNQIHCGEKHQNRSKRKRFYRIKKQISELKRLDKHQHLIDTLHDKSGLYDQQLECRIMNARSIHVFWRESHISDLSSRVDYLTDLLTKYFPTLSDLCEGYEEMLIVAYTSETTPLTNEEEQCLKNVIASSEKIQPTKVTFINGIDNDVKDEIALQIIVIYPIKIN